jgi:structure-specific recognition protein 1
LTPEIEGPLFDVLSKLFKEVIKINILIPGDFRSHKNNNALKCSVKASDGYLYPLKNSLIFIHKPVIFIKLQEIKFVELSRVG